MFSQRFGTLHDPYVVTSHSLDVMPVHALNSVVQRTPCFVDHDFDTDSLTIVPVRKLSWLGAYFGKFGTFEPRIGIVLETGLKHIRIYLYKYTIIIGQIHVSPLQAKVTLPDYPNDGLDSRPQRFGSGTDAADSLVYAIKSKPDAGFPDRSAGDLLAGRDEPIRTETRKFQLAERIEYPSLGERKDEGEARTDQAEARPE